MLLLVRKFHLEANTGLRWFFLYLPGGQISCSVPISYLINGSLCILLLVTYFFLYWSIYEIKSSLADDKWNQVDDGMIVKKDNLCSFSLMQFYWEWSKCLFTFEASENLVNFQSPAVILKLVLLLQVKSK